MANIWLIWIENWNISQSNHPIWVQRDVSVYVSVAKQMNIIENWITFHFGPIHAFDLYPKPQYSHQWISIFHKIIILIIHKYEFQIVYSFICLFYFE